ncbi:MAG: phosphatidylglycerophosphatase A [Epsilonproteobacteria bacterium]|nr:phosphatidylglycerophosphatase A [Campylobacterota bacterium]
MSLNRIFLTFFGLGLSPKAPGTVGSLGALIVAILLLRVIPMESLFMLTVAVSIIGIFEVDRYERESQTHDDKSIVIDEVAGMWISLIFSISVAMSIGFNYAYELSLILSFLTFRLFDIWKPSTIGFIDRRVKGGLGVMGDDILAGFASGALTSIIILLVGKAL